MTFHSILFDVDDIQKETLVEPDYFIDLNLNQVIDAIAERKKEYNLKPFFYTPLRRLETIMYRHDVMRDIEDENLRTYINAFAEKMIIMRRYLGLANRLDFRPHKQGWFLEAALVYCEAVVTFTESLRQADKQSKGFLGLQNYLINYVQSPAFQSLQKTAQDVKHELSQVQYSIVIQNDGFYVKKYENEIDYSIEVEKTFEKFKQGAVKSYLADIYSGAGMNHIEAKALEFVTLLYPQPFARLEEFYIHYEKFVDEIISTFDREVQFYVAYLEFIHNIQYKGLQFCYPQVGASREVYDYDGFDIALAYAFAYTDKTIVCNDFYLKNPERIIIVSGPNQGGKTTFARTFGQLHYLASLGCLVPGREARLFLFDQIYTHFERQEEVSNLRGKLEDDLVRIHQILSRITPDGILILNEIFASTTLQDAVFLSKEILAKLTELDILCVWVTFIDELSSTNEKTVSMVSTVVPDNPAERTFNIIRKPADGLAFALSLAEKHRLTYRQIKERISL